jgi:hypothetical protein
MTSTSHKEFKFFPAPSLLALFTCILTIKKQYFEYICLTRDNIRSNGFSCIPKEFFCFWFGGDLLTSEILQMCLGYEQKLNINLVREVIVDAPKKTSDKVMTTRLIF